MHIPDGFLSPETFVPAYGLAAGAWAFSVKKARKQLNEKLIGQLGMVSVFVLFASLFSMPVPGGSTVHLIAFPLMALLFGVPVSHLAYTLVLILQSLFFGFGGITSLGANSLIMGFISGYTVILVRKLTGFMSEGWSVFISTVVAILLAAFLFAFLLGVQPLIAKSENGKPLFFPFGPEITIPAVMFAHIWLSAAEGAITAYLYPRLRKILSRE
jgi:cobalt/nickel transport system permease protein